MIAHEWKINKITIKKGHKALHTRLSCITNGSFLTHIKVSITSFVFFLCPLAWIVLMNTYDMSCQGLSFKVQGFKPFIDEER
jgi:hypothetical protein